MGPLPDPVDMSGEKLDQLLTDVEASVGLNPVLRQVISRSSDTGESPTSFSGATHATHPPPRDASPRGAHA
eukprot:3707723-Alexandrium_andersonii.AAC.1